jgi:integrase
MWISTHWDRLTKAEGIECRFHDLRHWHASQLLGHGVSLPTVSRRLGHASTAVTAQVYAHVLGGADREAGDVIGAILQQD